MLNDDYRDMLQILSEEGVDFIIVGAYALAAHGYPRATGDIDIWVKPDADNAGKVLSSLKRFGSPLHSVTPGDFTVKGTIFQIGVVPCRIDIITAITGVEFEEARRDCLRVEIDGLTVPVLSIDKIIINKEATGREKDALDAKYLRKRRP
ncbi:MAG: nucleotidyltransferase [Spirochaetes bacterium]|nr:nucleotidyltransferase [Spirochaetota bacterium]